LPALDTLGRDLGWKVEATPDTLKQAMAAAIDGKPVAVYQDAGPAAPLDLLPEEWPRLAALAELAAWDGPALVVSDRVLGEGGLTSSGPRVVYRPPTLVVGIGTSTGAPPDDAESLVRETLARNGLASGSVGLVATIDRRRDEPAIVALAHGLGAEVQAYSAERLAAVPDAPTPSSVVASHVGTPGVCEPAAILASDGGALIIAKVKSAHATVAVARRGAGPVRPGHLSLVSLGPGNVDLMTPRARSALDLADIVIGYSGYLDSLDGIVPTHRMRPYALGQERDRASEAIRLAQAGRLVALVSSGDVGVYGMAGLVFELMAQEAADSRQPAPFVEVVPGVTAATAAAALLGAPLMLDFAAISLSDLLVPWDTVERRLRAAAEGDLTIVLYNPASQRRRAGLARAHEIILQHRPATTPVGIVREAYRQDQVVGLSTLGELPLDQVDMRTVLVIGCSRTEVLAGRLVTRRGYQDAVGDPTVRAESTHARP
jgi:cobalt-precorrin 5A hydrolase/precorrin-3B C17-methyltransferase